MSGIPNPNLVSWKFTHFVRRLSYVSLLKFGGAEGGLEVALEVLFLPVSIVMAGEVRVPPS